MHVRGRAGELTRCSHFEAVLHGDRMPSVLLTRAVNTRVQVKSGQAQTFPHQHSGTGNSQSHAARYSPWESRQPRFCSIRVGKTRLRYAGRLCQYIACTRRYCTSKTPQFGSRPVTNQCLQQHSLPVSPQHASESVAQLHRRSPLNCVYYR